MQPAKDKTAFKDYCLILQVHPEADAEMIDAAYWHLVRRYSEARHADPSAEAQIDDLNEAYSVLRSPARREEYYRLRDAVLGVGALPAAPPPESQPVPLEVMARQRPRPRELEQRPEVGRGRHGLASLAVPGWQNVVAALVILGLAAAALVDSANPLVVATLLGSGVAVTTLPLWRRFVPLSAPRLRLSGRRKAGTHDVDSDSLRETHAVVRQHIWEAGRRKASQTSTPLQVSDRWDRDSAPPESKVN